MTHPSDTAGKRPNCLPGAKFSERAYEEAVRNCFLHKLTYKFPAEYLEDADSWASRLSRRGGAG